MSNISTGFGIKVSKAGVDVDKALEKQLLFFSGFISLKVASNGVATATITTDATGAGITTISHTFSYQPAIIGFYSTDQLEWKQVDNLVIVINSNTSTFDFISNSVYGIHNSIYYMRYFIMADPQQ